MLWRICTSSPQGIVTYPCVVMLGPSPSSTPGLARAGSHPRGLENEPLQRVWLAETFLMLGKRANQHKATLHEVEAPADEPGLLIRRTRLAHLVYYDDLGRVTFSPIEGDI